MKNTKKNSKAEYLESWDAGTYQTGNTTPPKRSNPLTAVLLMLVIFLGGIASALGLVNLRLLMALQEAMPEPTVNLQLQAGKETSDTFLSDDAVPSIPEDMVTMSLADPNIMPAEEMTDALFLSMVNSATVTVSGEDNVSGFGLVLTEDGYILTYAHVVEHQERVYVTLPDGTRHRAAVVGWDALTDLAVVYIRATGLTPAGFSNTATFSNDSYRVWFNRSNALHGGAMCPTGTTVPLGNEAIDLLQTSAATNHEQGALWNSNCQVVGILSPCISDFFQEEEGELAWVIPSSTVKQIVDQILANGHVAGRPTLEADMEELSELYRDYWALPNGLRITDSENPALLEGDLLVTINGQSVSSCQELYSILFTCKPGQTLEATVIRGGEEICILLTVCEESCED